MGREKASLSAWGLSLREISDEGELARAWSVLGLAFDPPLWDFVDEYGSYVSKVAANAVTLLLVCDGEPCASISFYANDRASLRAFVTQLMVAPAWQGSGLGTWLLGECERRATAAGMEAIGLEVRDGNEGARRLYERVGFRPCGRTASGTLMVKALR